VLRAWHLLKQMRCNKAALLVAYALEQGLASRLLPRERPFVVAAPEDAALHAHGELAELMRPDGHRRLVALLRRHCLTGDRALRLEKREVFEIDGVPVRSGPHDVGGYRGYVIGARLPEESPRD